MATLTTDAPISQNISKFSVVPCIAADIVYEGALVGDDATGYGRPLVAGDKFLGHCMRRCDNASGSAGDKNIEILVGEAGKYRLEVSITGAALDRIGWPIYATDDATLTFDPPASGMFTRVGKFVRYVSSGVGIVEFEPNLPLDVASGPASKLLLEEDFFGDWSTIAGPWKVVDVGDATEAGANTVNGVFALAIAATDEAEDAVLYHGDKLSFDIDQLETMEFRAAVVTPGTGITVVAGMAGAHNLDKDTVAQNAWFRLDASLALDVESDDGTNDNDDKTTALTLVTATYYDFMIDFRDTADVKFYVNGTQVATATTYDMSNYTAGLQPYFSLDKASGTGTATLSIDRVRITGQRT